MLNNFTHSILREMAGKGNVLRNKKQVDVPLETTIETAEVEQPKFEKKIKQKVEKAKEKKNSQSENKAIQLLNDNRTTTITSIFLMVFSVFLTASFVSYLFTWKGDQSLVSGSWFDLFRYSDFQVKNHLGKLGAVFSHVFIYTWFGIASFVIAGLVFLFGFKKLFNVDLLPMNRSLRVSIFILLFLPPSLSFGFSSFEDLQFLGGGIGYEISNALVLSIGKFGTGLLLSFVGLSFCIATFNLKFSLPQKNKSTDETTDFPIVDDVISNVGNKFKGTNQELNDELEVDLHDDNINEDELSKIVQKELLNPIDDVIDLPIITPPIVDTNDGSDLEINIPSDEPQVVITNSNVDNGSEGINVVTEEEVDLVEKLGEYDPTLDLSSYQYPTLDLLENYSSSRSAMSREELMAELEANKKRIIETLGHYDIEIEKIKATVGPTVTLFEIIPKAGIRISKIKNLEDDIALSLAALGIRIIAPIPGKGTIGIEVPNQHPDMVSMRSIMSSEKFQNSEFDLPIALGKTISNEIFVADLSKMPHLLMAGATGQGKSVGLNAVLVSLLYKKHPAQVKFVLVDPKKVELTLFKTIERHFLAKLPGDGDAIITDTKKVVNTVNSLCIEMDNRYELLKEASVRNIKEYNSKFISRKLNPNNGHRFLPYIVLVVDEFADLIMTAGKEIETPIARLAQLARAIGIHLIIATQRPSVNIITGTIKANFPARLAFKVTSKIDSRTILDTGGADQLIGRGDMLLSTGADLIRVQCAFVDTPEVEAITSYIGNQRGYSDAYILPEYVGEGDAAGGGNEFGTDELDPLFDEAAHMVVQFQQGSASLLQRRLKLGYNRAGRLVDQLEAAGIIGPFEGSKAREVRCKDMNSLEQLLKNMRSPSGV